MPSPGTIPKAKCGLSLEDRIWRRDDDIGKQHIFGVDRRRSVERSDHRHWNVQQI